MPRWALLVAVFLVCAYPASCFAISLSISNTVPTEDVLLNYRLDGYGNFHGAVKWVDDTTSGRWEPGQTFLLGTDEDTYLTGITLSTDLLSYSVFTGIANTGYQIEMWTFTDAHDDYGDALINTQTGVLPGVSDLSTGYWTFEIDRVRLAAGQQYGWMLAFTDGAAPDRELVFHQDYGAEYAGGQSVIRQGTPPEWGLWRSDIHFGLEGYAVPEPSSFALFALGLGAVALRRRLSNRAE